MTVLTVAAVVALSGCSAAIPAATDTTASASAEAPADFRGNGYSYNVPEGWGDTGQDLTGTGIDTYAADLADQADGFADNINVLLSPNGLIPADTLEEAAVAELEAVDGAENITVESPADFGGYEALHISAQFTQSGVTYLIDQFYPASDTQTYVVTFSFSPDASDDHRAEVIDAVASSWVWK